MVGAIYTAIDDALNYELDKQKHIDEVKLKQRGLDIQEYNAKTMRYNADTMRYNAQTDRMRVNYNYDINREKNSLEARRVSQLELTNAMQGNSWDNASKIQDLKTKQIEQQQQILQQQQKAIEGLINRQDMMRAVRYLGTGNYEDANKVINANPMLKEQLKTKFGVTRVEGIDFNNPADVDALKKLGVNVSTLSPEAKNALRRRVFKSYTPDGQIQIHGIDELMKEINADKYMTTQDLNDINNHLNIAKTVVSDQPVTPPLETITENDIKHMAQVIAEREKLNYDDVYNSLADMVTVQGIDNKKELLNGIAISDETRNYLLSEDQTGDLKQIKDQLEITKKQLEIANKQEDLKNKQLKNSQQIKETATKEVANKYRDQLLNDPKIWQSSKDDPEIAKMLKSLQGKKELPASILERVTRRTSIAIRGRKLLPELEKSLKGTGAVTQIKQMLDDYFTGNIKSKEDLKKYKEANQKAISIIYDYINAISGQAMSDQELQRRLEAAGFSKWKRGENVVEGFKNFIESVEQEVNNDINTYKHTYPYDMYNISREFNKYNPKTPFKIKDVKPSLDGFFKGAGKNSKIVQKDENTKTINLENYDTED